ncbi:hypothetical protein KIL84_020239, partial [Mauremys mutica]
ESRGIFPKSQRLEPFGVRCVSGPAMISTAVLLSKAALSIQRQMGTRSLLTPQSHTQCCTEVP